MSKTRVFFQIIIVVLLFGINIHATELSENKQFSISNEFGFISESFIRSKNDTPVIIIQDLHKDKTTQTNIKNIVDEIDKNYGLENIFIEGLYNKPVWNKENSYETADLLFENLYLSGAEYFCLKNDALNKILPLDESQYYNNNIQRLAYLIMLEPEINKSITVYDKVISTAKTKILSSQNKKIDTLINKYYNGKISQKKFYSSLKKYINQEDIENMPNIKIYFKYIETKILNQKKLNKEFDCLITDFKNVLPYKHYVELANKISKKEDFLFEIEKLSAEYNIDLNTYEEIKKYITLDKMISSMNSFNFIDEERQLLRELKIKYSKSKNETLLIILDDLYSYYKDFLKNKLTEYGYNYLNDFGIDNFMNLWVNILATKDIYVLKELHKYFDEYNKTNIYRSEIFIDKILELKQHIDGNIVAVMGGFHTRQIAEYLKYKNISYVVITPKLNGLSNDNQDLLYKQNILRSMDLKYNAIPAPSVLNDEKECNMAIHYCFDERTETELKTKIVNKLMNLFNKIKAILLQKFYFFLNKKTETNIVVFQQITDKLEQLSEFYRNNSEQNIKQEQAINLINEINKQAKQSKNYLRTLQKLINKANEEFLSNQQNFKLELFKTNNTVKIIVVNLKDSSRRSNFSKVFTFSGEEIEEHHLEEKLNIYDNMSKKDFLNKFKISNQEYEKLQSIISSKNSKQAIEFLQKTNNINVAYYIFFHFNYNIDFVKEVVNNKHIDVRIRLYAYMYMQLKIQYINISEDVVKNLLENTGILIKKEMIVGSNNENRHEFNSFLENELFRNEIFVSYHAAILLYLQSVFPEKQISKETITKLLEARIDKNYNGSGDSRFIYGEEHIWNNTRFANISAHEIGHNFLYDLSIDRNRTERENIFLRKFVQVIHEFYAQNTAHIFINGNGFGNGQILNQCRGHFHGLTKQYESAERDDGNYQYNFNNRSPHLGGYSLLYMLNDLLDLSDNNSAIYLSKAIENITPQFINKIQTVNKYTVYDYAIELLEEYGKLAGYDVSNTIKYLQNNRPITNYDDVWLFPKLDQIPQQYHPIPLKSNFAQSYKEAKIESLYPAFDVGRNVKYDVLNKNAYINLLTAS
jgi:hypothetical protein